MSRFFKLNSRLIFTKFFYPKMNYQTAAKAVELKNLIDKAHLYLPKIGRCLSLELEFKREYTDFEDEEGDDDNKYYTKKKQKYGETEERIGKTEYTARTLEEIQDKLAKIYDIEGFRMKGSGFEDGSINVLGKEIQSLRDISIEDIEKWYDVGRSSAFGNVMKQETQHDAKVRSSRELDITQFSVSQKLLVDVAQKWGEKYIPESVNLYTTRKTLSIWGQKFIPDDVQVEPYKIVIYGPGDHFQFHKDTPQENLCGTFLISLYGNCKPSSSFEIRQGGKSFHWSGNKNNGWCAFYPDIPHRVEVLESGYRAVLSFKIFAKNQQ